MFHENGKDSVIVNHMTNNQILPWNGAVDVAYDGEANVIYPEMGKDFMDCWTLERLFMDVPATWGVNINFMNEYQGNWQPPSVRRCVRTVARCCYTTLCPPATAPTTRASVRSWPRVTGLKSRRRCRFHRLLEARGQTGLPDEKCLPPGWVKPGKVLVGVVNWGEKTEADVTLDLKKLGLPTTCKVWDAENPETQLAIDAGGRLLVPVERHDFRLLIVESK